MTAGVGLVAVSNNAARRYCQHRYAVYVVLPPSYAWPLGACCLSIAIVALERVKPPPHHNSYKRQFLFCANAWRVLPMIPRDRLSVAERRHHDQTTFLLGGW